MCGRFFRHKVSWEEYYAQLNLFRPKDIPEMEAGYNIAPTQIAPIIRAHEDGDQLELAFAMWGLVPGWWHKPLSEKKFTTFNAKSETAPTASSFRYAFKNRPCLVPMSGYYEWKGTKGNKQPFAISMRNRRWFLAAGLWDRTEIDGKVIESFTILTAPSVDWMNDLHARMPVFPEQSEARAWIEGTPEEREAICQAGNITDLYSWKVGKAVGNVRNQGEELIEELDAPML